MARGMAISAAAMAIAVLLRPGPADARDKLVLQLHRQAQFEFAGYYAGLWKGFFRDAGIDLTIKPGAPPGAAPTDPVREVTEGRAQFGTSSDRLLVRAAQGLQLILLAPVFQQSGAMIYYRADADFSSPEALINARIGRLPASNILEIELRTALRSEGVDPDKLRSVALEPGQTIAAFANHRIDAAVGSAWDLPWLARESGLVLKSFNPAAYRVGFYGDGLFTLQRLYEAQPDLVRRFRAASLKGWEYAFQHPDEIIADFGRELPPPAGVKDPVGFAHYQAAIARQLAGYPLIPLGHSNPERWRRIQRNLIEVAAIVRPAGLGGFLYDPDAAARERTDLRDGLIMIVAAIAVLAAAGILFWTWRRRPVAAAGLRSAGGPPADDAVSRTVATLAGELRSAIDGLAEPIEQIGRQTANRPRLARLCDSARSGVERLRSLGRRLTATVAPGSPELRPCDLNAMLSELDRSIRQLLPPGVGFRLSLVAEPWLAEADPDAVAAMILELVAAAAADIPAGGELIVGTRHHSVDAAMAADHPGSRTGEHVRITVRDDGPGFAPEQLDLIFDPAATPRPPVIAAAAMTERQGGFLRVESAEGVGTAVHLYFRRAAIAPAAPTEADDSSAKAAE
jgi:ABC-type nitrate/sulfonate/bicarbonate transport system substrate-binding protein/signal transduction histidine kinase